ncbi:putative sugar transporter [Aspergillus violaceofuscus CBS 115571]|uniref:Putative sugar transporter n=1 Tax=Aspergillus violaceofuscus (strain CBS 115571) TaxID=1450538 RepID=A0A2V5GXY3_ASPV1|nr:putative sugar transporter [Aspergillus violaceofuscus CBS 115571]
MGAAGGGFDKSAFQKVPKAARKPYIWLAVIWASYCGGLHGFNTSNISGAMSLAPFVRDFGWTNSTDSQISNDSGWAVSSMLLGQTAGVIFSGPFGERYGRKLVILFAAILYTIGAILMAANFGSFAQLLAGRVLSGLGSGLGMTVGPVYISEVAPQELRGMMTTFYNINIMAGVAGSYWINYASLEVLPPDSSWQWRATLTLQLIPSLALFLGYPFFPESPRYLFMRGETTAARNSLRRLRGGLSEADPYLHAELTDLHLLPQSESNSKGGLAAIKHLITESLHDRPTAHLLTFVLLIQTFFIMSGGNSITYYAPTILKSIGLSSQQRLLFTAVYGLIKLLTIFLYAFLLTDRYGRRPLLLIGSTICTACLLYLCIFLGVADISAGGSPSAAAWLAIVAICLFAVGYGVGWAPVFSLTASEICPTRLRGPVVAVAFTYQNLLNFGITRGFPNMVREMHSWGPFALFAACTALATGWVWVAFPECKGRSMEGCREVFVGVRWYRTGFVGHLGDALITSQGE